MLRLKDLQNRVYSGKQCAGFQVHVVDDKHEEMLEATYKRHKDDDNTWSMQVLVPRTRDKDTEVYVFDYTMPKSNLPLELVAATGMRYFQLYLQQEIQTKSGWDFAIGELVEGM